MKLIPTCMLACFFLFSNGQEILLDSITFFSVEENTVVSKQIFEYDSDQNITAYQLLSSFSNYQSYRNQNFKYKSGNILDTVFTKSDDPSSIFFGERYITPSQAVITYPSSDSIVMLGYLQDEDEALFLISRYSQKYNPEGKLVSDLLEIYNAFGDGNFLEYANSLYFYSENDKIDSIQFFTYNPYSNGLDKTEVWYYDYKEGQIRQVLKLQQDGGGELVPFEEALYSAFQNELFGKKETFEYSPFDGEIISFRIDSSIFDDEDRLVTSYNVIYYNGEIVYQSMSKLEYYDDFVPVKSLDGSDFFTNIVNPTAQQEYDPQNLDIVDYKIKSNELYDWNTDSGTYILSGNIDFFYSDFSSKAESVIAKNLLNIYPNPVKGVLNIEGIENIGLATYWIYGMDGQLLMNQKLSTNNIDVTKLNAGAYLLRIQTDSSYDASMKRFIKI